jgi:hypothetical protein
MWAPVIEGVTGARCESRTTAAVPEDSAPILERHGGIGIDEDPRHVVR